MPLTNPGCCFPRWLIQDYRQGEWHAGFGNAGVPG